MRRFLALVVALVALAAGAYMFAGGEPETVAGPGIEELARASSGRVPESALSARVISRDDLPPDGTRSLFDHMIAANGGLPYPFEKLTEMLAAQDRDGQRLNSLLIPDGRSLLKGYADFAHPRVVVSADMRPPSGTAELQPLYRGRLFLGFVELADEIEVISYNEAAGRFEFQLVEDYCEGCTPRIVYAKRAICTTCHAAGGPIFPVRPWEETNAQPAIADRIEAAIDTGQYAAEPLRRKLENAEQFDNLTDIGNVIPTTQRVWLDGCGEAREGAECRRLMLRIALAYALTPAAFDAAAQPASRLRELQARAWPAGGIALGNGDLNNRNPLQSALYDTSLRGRIRQLFAPTGYRPARGGDKLEDFDRLPPLPAEFDPLARRAPKKVLSADDLDGVFGIAQMFSQDDLDRIDSASGYSAARLDEALDSLADELFEPAPFRRTRVLPALLAALGQPAPPYCCGDVSAMSPPIAQGEPPLELAGDSVLKPFEEYCFGCHRGNPSAKLDFMSGPDEATVLARIAEVSEIREALDYERYLGTDKAAKLMPPEDSWQRERLDAALARGEDPLTPMRDQVPSLFDF